MTRPAPRTFTVLGKQTVTPRMLRITLGGEGMKTFPDDQASAYVKLMLPVAGRARPLLRTYTVRAQRADAIDIDFALHGDDGDGPASRWAVQSRVGDRIDIGGPGPKKLADPDAEWIVLTGDMTALPAISVNLEHLPATARGYAVIEVTDETDIQPLPAPAGMQLQWVVNPRPGQATPLLDAIAALDWPQGRVSVWAACEFTSMRALREHFRQVRGVERSAIYISSYWKLGSDEDNHKVIKRNDADLEQTSG